MDRGFASDDNFIKLQSAGGHYIIGEKMRSGKPEVEAALSKKGRYTELRTNLLAKESIVGEGERRIRYIIVKNPAEAKKDLETREKHIKTLLTKLEALGDLKGKAHTKAVCELIAHRVYGRYLKTLKSGELTIDKSKVAEETKLDGKYLIRTSDDTLSIEDVALGYKQLMDVERAFRTLKTELELRPVHHRKSGRIRAHVLICWMALLLVRVAEIETGMTWFNLLRVLDAMKVVTLQSEDGKAEHVTAPSKGLISIFSACKLDLPPKLLGFARHEIIEY
jgi:transposase